MATAGCPHSKHCMRSVLSDWEIDLPILCHHARSKRSKFITLSQAATKSAKNFFSPSELP